MFTTDAGHIDYHFSQYVDSLLLWYENQATTPAAMKNGFDFKCWNEN